MNSPPVNFLNMETKNNALNFVVIDDDTINNMVCKAAIKSATGGKTAICFNKPLEGLHYFENLFQLLNSSPRTILFLDINMPDMNGWEWLEKFSGFQQEIKDKLSIYILSSSVNPTDIDHAHANSLVKDYIVKPLTKSKVLDLLEETNSESIMDLKVV